VITAPKYLANVKAPRSIDDLRDHNLLWYSELAINTVMSAEGSETPLNIEPVIISGNETMLLLAAVQGAGIATLPRWLTQDDIAAGRLVKVFEKGHVYRRPLLAVYQTRRHVPSKIRVFLEFLIESPHLNG